MSDQGVTPEEAEPPEVQREKVQAPQPEDKGQGAGRLLDEGGDPELIGDGVDDPPEDGD